MRSSWTRPATVLILGALGLGYWSCATTQEPDPAEASQIPSTDSPGPTDPAQTVAIADESDQPILLPVLNEEALTARVAAQRRLLGGNLFEDVRGRPVPWITPQGELPEPDDDVVTAADSEGSIDDALLDSLPGSSGLGAGAGDPTAVATGLPVNGNALGLFVPLETEPAALAKFYGALEDLRQGRDTDGKVRVLIYGGSHTDADIYPQYIRSYLQERFGDGGHGFVHVARPWRWYRHVDYRVEGAKYWITEHAQRRKGRDDGFYGLMGCSLAAKSKRAFGKVIPRGDAVGATYEIFFLRQPKGGGFEVLADGKKLATVKTRADEVGAGYHRFTLPEGQHEIEVKLDGKGEVRLFGMTIEREQPGVVVDTLGIGGTRAANMLRWDQATWTDNVAHRDPDLVMMFYGTNEATDEDQPISAYESDLRSVLERIQVASPHASCLIMGPGDFPRRSEDGTWHNRPRIDDIITVQRRVASEMGCAFWDTKAFMGGELSMPLWAAAQPPMAKQDHIHFTKRGYVRIGMGVVDALMMGFDGDDADLGG
ncbi:GDSL-type esterase/lipase family protein [Paraliomyxa miuraensis]|uniref:GDSL-type esterase/lipase family protein n=1 Tax=Paraliomyxa miuraensis TaxID=376150 RepID=UPI00225929C5|nr:GDSL-type esterase/lipase family protein [Paraliomyxa miuraensis]MCX4247689.1 GDSL-type esterase/lipase family protein [Paraliomyxa miuraensis]